MPANAYSKPGQQRFAFAGMRTVSAPDAMPEGKLPLAINVHAYLDDAITPRLPQSDALVTVASGLVHSLRRMNDNTSTLYSVSKGPNSPAASADVSQPGGIPWGNVGNILTPDNQFASVTLASTASSASSGPNNPADVLPSVIRPGSWVAPNGIFALDGVYASTGIQGGTISQQLTSGGYGFAIPSNAIITGIRITVTAKAGANGAIFDSSVLITQGTSTPTRVGTEHANGSTLTTTPQAFVYGSSTDLWGLSWTPDLINQHWFGLAIQWRNVLGVSNSTQVFVDCIQIEVFYTTFPVAVSDYLEATNFGFAIPGGATIAGIKVDVLGFQTHNFSDGNTVAQINVGLMQGGLLVTPLFPQQLSLSNGYLTFGGNSNLWLPSPTWTSALLNASDFGVVIQASGGGPTVTFKIDYVRVTVWYYTGSPVTGYVLVSGAADKLYVGNTQVDSGYSQSRLAMVPFRPNDSVRPWMYIGDLNKLSKVSSDGTLYKTGIQEPQSVPTLASAGAGNLTGDYFYAYRYRSSATGARSNLSPISPVSGANDFTAAAQNVTVTCTASADPQADLIDIFRFGVGLLAYTYIGTVPNGTPTFVDSLTDTQVENNEEATFDDFEPFPSIDTPKVGTLTVSNGPYTGTKTLTWASGDHFNVRWLGGTIVTLGTGSGSTQVTLFNRPSSTTIMVGIIQPPGSTLANGTYSFNIIAPNLAAQPLPAFWGPTDNAAYMFACGDPIRPGTLYFTKGNNPDSAPQTNQIEITSPSEPLIGGSIVGGLGIVFSTERAWLLYPNFAQATATIVGIAGQPFQPVESITERGLWTKEGICTDGGGMLFFIAKDGIRSSAAGAGSQSITDDIDNLFPHEGLTQKPYTIAGYTVSPPDYTQPDGMCLRFSQGYVYFDYVGLDGNRHTLKYHVRKQAWSVDQYTATATVHADNEGQGTVGSPPLLAIGVLTGCIDSTIRQLSSTATETGQQMTVLTPSVGGVTRPVKHFGDIYIESSFPASAAPQFALALWTGRYATQQPGMLSPSSVPLPAIARAGSIIEVNNGDGLFVQDVGLQIVGPIVAPGLASDGTSNVYAALYLWEPTLIEQPEDTGLRVTDWDDGGYPGAKFVQGVIIEADTGNVLKTFHVESGDDQSSHALAEMGIGVAFANQTQIAFSFAQPFVAHNMRLVPDDSVPWRLFSVKWVYAPIPEECLEWHTESTGHGIRGWQHVKEVNIEHISTADITLTLIADTGARVQLTIPNSGGVQAKTLVIVPAQWSNQSGTVTMSPKFQLVSYNFTSSAPCRIWKEDVEVLVGRWGRNSEYAVVKPFGGQSDSQSAEV